MILHSREAGDTPEKKKQKIESSGYGSGSKMANAVLEVEGQELHVNKEVGKLGYSTALRYACNIT